MLKEQKIFACLLMAVMATMSFGSIVLSQQNQAEFLLHQADSAYQQRFALKDTGDFILELDQYRPFLEEAMAFYEKAWDLRETLSIQSQAYIADRLAQLSYELTAYYDSAQDKDKIEELLWQGKEYGFESLSLNPEFKEDDLINTLQYVNDVAALTWTADCWGTWLGYHPLQGLINIAKVKAMYQRAVELDDSFWGASAHNALGALMMTTPSFLGGSKEKGKSHLLTALEIAPDYLINHTVLAEYLGFQYNSFGKKTGIQDQALIIKETSFVLNAPIGREWPFWNRVAKLNAQALLKELDTLTGN